uniref:Rab3 GTPase-activating protein catalytic subunit n=1 Tax=Macrostomum lignano TaxID=282301 RepID=A0A1I8I0K5_9PLAT
SEALPDRQRAALFQAVRIETVLLYNAETWTLTDSLEQQVDAAHAGLLRTAFKIGYEHSITAPACPIIANCCIVGDSSWQATSSAPSPTLAASDTESDLSQMAKKLDPFALLMYLHASQSRTIQANKPP